jgi:ribonucleoside-diphosphate reductase alpha chain
MEPLIPRPAPAPQAITGEEATQAAAYLRAGPGMQGISQQVLMEKYAGPGERLAQDIQRRVARALAAVEPEAQRARWERLFLQCLQDGFIPAGRIQCAAGAGLKATLINCFVQPLSDALTEAEDGLPGIHTALAEAAETMRLGGGVGYDFSRIRPVDARVTASRSPARGPLSHLHVFDSVGQTLVSAGARRGAQMGVLRCDHPDIEAFIHAKAQGGLKNFNLAVGVTDAFMQAVANDRAVELVHRTEPAQALRERGAFQRPDGAWVYRSVRAAALWDQIMRSAYDHGEPGVLFLDTINRDNNLAWCETINATNPCAEQPLPPYGGCCLGSVDLTRFVIRPFEPDARFDGQGFARVCTLAVRMLDNVLDASTWPLPQQADEARRKRRVGLGFTGLGDALVMLNLRYDSGPARAMASHIANLMRDAAYGASIELARERGPFPLFNAELYLPAGPGCGSGPAAGTSMGMLPAGQARTGLPPGHGSFASRLPQPLRERIRQHGLRNSHLLSIAPAGTISLAFADNASNGIEPAFSWTYQRKRRLADGTITEDAVEDHAWRLFRHLKGPGTPLTPAFVTALQLRAQDHIAMLAAVAPFIDAAISKTVNVPADYPFTDFQDLYLMAWKAGLKGLTAYRPNRITSPVLCVAGGQHPP